MRSNKRLGRYKKVSLFGSKYDKGYKSFENLKVVTFIMEGTEGFKGVRLNLVKRRCEGFVKQKFI